MLIFPIDVVYAKNRTGYKFCLFIFYSIIITEVYFDLNFVNNLYKS